MVAVAETGKDFIGDGAGVACQVFKCLMWAQHLDEAA